MSAIAISRQTDEALKRVMRFFGIDEYNRYLFSTAAKTVGVEQFSRTIEAIDVAIASDPRTGVAERIRRRIENEKSIKRAEQMKGKK